MTERRKREPWEIELDRELEVSRKAKTCRECGAEKDVGQVLCPACNEEAKYLLDQFLREEGKS